MGGHDQEREELEAERDRLADQVARARELQDRWASGRGQRIWTGPAAAELGAALDGAQS